MNMLSEGLKENGPIVVVPSPVFEFMQVGGLAGMTMLTMESGRREVAAATRSNPVGPRKRTALSK
jgi:hypothetical protein